MSDDSSSARIRSAASLIVKGGTLTSEQCPRCGGVQVRFGDKTTCINCGNEVKAGGGKAPAQPNQAEKAAQAQQQQQQQPSAGLASAALLIEEKVAQLASEIRAESDISVQKQKAELLESYLRILEKTKSMIG